MKYKFFTLPMLILCICLVSPLSAANNYNNTNWQSMTFVQMMLSMMKAMNKILGSHYSYNDLHQLPYSPGTITGAKGFSAFSQLPMSPVGVNSAPIYSDVNSWNDAFSSEASFDRVETSSLWKDASDSNFWAPVTYNKKATESTNMGSLNGIWQTLKGEVFVIYNNNNFIWSDAGTRHIAGQISITGNNLLTYVPAKKKTLYFKFYREPGQFVVQDSNAKIYTFKRVH